MPYFSEHKILFIHIPKNAGMYIEKSLGVPSEFDLVPWWHKIGKRISRLAYRTSRRLLDPKRIAIEQSMRLYRYGDSAGMFKCQHATLSEVISLRMLNREELVNCSVLAVHRHPLARAVSMYQWSAVNKFLTFDQFCEKWILDPWNNNLNYGQLSHVRSQSSYVEGCEQFGERFKLIAFENLSLEFSEYCREHNIQQPNSKKVNQSKSLQVEVSDRARSIIADVYEDDYINFGYDIESY